MTSAVSDGAASVSLTTLAEVSGLTAEGTLVDFAVTGSAERHAVGLEFAHGNRCLTGHVLDGILISEPVRALDGVIEVETPVVFVHVAESGIDTSLHSKIMRHMKFDFVAESKSQP